MCQMPHTYYLIESCEEVNIFIPIFQMKQLKMNEIW